MEYVGRERNYYLICAEAVKILDIVCVCVRGRERKRDIVQERSEGER